MTLSLQFLESGRIYTVTSITRETSAKMNNHIHAASLLHLVYPFLVETVPRPVRSLFKVECYV